MPKLSPATFPPAMREPAPPALDQFDLDEHFAKEGKHSYSIAHGGYELGAFVFVSKKWL